jgi:hypothetical protein
MDNNLINDLRHNHFLPLYQSLKAHSELAGNDSLHISPSVLKDVIRRVQLIENLMMGLLNGGEK